MTGGRGDGATFTRSSLTLLAYGGAAIFGVAVTSLGPAMPLLRAELHISRAVAGLHITALAAAAVTLGFATDRVARRWGRRNLLWLGGMSMSAGGLGIALGHHAAVTIAAATLIGSGGTFALAAARSALADEHGGARTVALAEADASWAAGAIVSGLLIGAVVGAGFSWRLVFPLPTVLWLALFARAHRLRFPPATATAHVAPASRRRLVTLPRTYWIYWSALLPSGAAEWCITVWAAGFLVDEAKLGEGTASLVVTVYFVAMFLGRFTGSRLARRISAQSVLAGAFFVAVVGTLSFWLSRPIGVRVVALFVTGLGVSLLFPMILSLAMGAAEGSTDAAAARVSTAAGAAMLVAPVTLGWVADQIGINKAFALVPMLLVIGAALATVGSAVLRRVDPLPTR